MARVVMVTKGACRGKRREQDEESQLSLVAFLLAAIRKSVVSCRVDRQDEVVSAAVRHMEMDIGWPANVRHVTHVTFDRFHGFLGLPVEFQVEIPCRVPSASANVFGVSPESMQCSYDSKENSVPTILLLMQERLYSQGGLKAEGIFRINPENSKEEHVRDQLNKGIVPDDIDVHCLAGLIKAWFRELPEGVLDGLSPEQVLQCNTEEESVDLVKLLMPTQAALLNWAVDLMADVVEEEESNKMNARNIAMVFAPNMTQMADPLTALMHAVQVMNLLKTLIIKTLREREEAASAEEGCWSDSSSSNEQTDEEFEGQKEVDRSCTPSDSSPSSNQQIDDEFDDQKEVDMICAARICKSDEDSETYSQSSDDELDTLKEIEECFLQQLEGKDGLMNEQKTMEMNGSDLNIELGLSISETKCDTTSTSDAYSRTSIDEDASNGNPSKECYKDHNDKINEVQLMLLNKCSCDEKMNEVQLKPLNECSLACVPPNLANQEVLQLNN